MSEAELHILKARMRGGQLNKARRGELEMCPPVGLIYRTDGTIGLDPDAQVQSAIRLVFETFERTGSAVQTLRFFRQQGLLFPRRLRTGPNKGDLLWAPPQHARILQVLHNPRYAGAFVYGRTRIRHRADGGTSVVKVARADWQFVMPGMYQGYIDWERFEANQHRLTDNARSFGGERRSGPAREGPALLQGRVLCGLCGERMGVRYSQQHGCTVPTYVCQETAVRRAGKTCQTVPGKVVDAAVAALLIEMMTPMTLAVTLEVERELETRATETDAVRRQHVERMRYEADLARRRYMKVDPDNRLVADTLEAEWNDKLRLHAEAAEEYERRSKQQAATLSAEARQRILGLAEQLPQIWKDPRVDSRERKRIVRLLIDDVTLIKAQTITAHVRLSGGATRTLVLDRPLPIAQIRKFKPALVATVDQLLDQHCDREIADILNRDGWQTWEGKPFNLKKVAFIRHAYKLASRHERLRRRGMLTTREVAAKFGVSETAVHEWGRQGLITKSYSDNLNRGLWKLPAQQTILRGCGGRGARPARLVPITAPSSGQGAV
jgi:DNA invertase Pin-like site-specific DNA recombinase